MKSLVNDNRYIPIRGGMFLAKDDPQFNRKYALYFPTDGDGLYRYAKELEETGRQKMANAYFAKAKQYGTTDTDFEADYPKEGARNQLSASPEDATPEKKKKSDKALNITLLAASALLLALLFLIGNTLFQKSAEATPADESSVVTANDDPSSALTFVNDETPDEQVATTSDNTPVTNSTNEDNSSEIIVAGDETAYTTEELAYLIALNAIMRYKEERGEYPANFEALTKGEPENWVSDLPEEVSYRSTLDGFALYPLDVTDKFGINPADPSTMDEHLFELHFYSASNELALVSGETVLAVYPVASGATPLPETSRKVLSRVVEPNGKGSALGSRGFALADNYAIHGTNDPTSIGTRKTDGCLRLHNAEIEALYPYVSKGTPVVVKAESFTETPMFEMGLPVLNPNSTSYKNETTPDMVYNWKN